MLRFSLVWSIFFWKFFYNSGRKCAFISAIVITIAMLSRVCGVVHGSCIVWWIPSCLISTILNFTPSLLSSLRWYTEISFKVSHSMRIKVPTLSPRNKSNRKISPSDVWIFILSICCRHNFHVCKNRWWRVSINRRFNWNQSKCNRCSITCSIFWITTSI